MQARKESQNLDEKKQLAGKCRELMKWGEDLKKLKEEQGRRTTSSNVVVETLSVDKLYISQGKDW